jgi:UDP-glucose 4-epimerase
MDKVTVIGGSGFLGSHVADELTERGYQVTVLDRVSSPWVTDNQEMVVGDMLDNDSLIKACSGSRYLYHFGGIADIGEAMANPYKAIETNVLGAAKALETALVVGVERFVYASTMYVYSAACLPDKMSQQHCKHTS